MTWFNTQKHSVRLLRIAVALVLTIAISIIPMGSPSSGFAADPNTAPGAPIGLLTEDVEAPLNVVGPPHFTWWPQDVDKNEVQTAYQIIVKDAIDGAVVWDSGKVASSEQSWVVYTGPGLDHAHPYTWTVSTWDAQDEKSPVSAAAKFATGLNDDEWGGAKWLKVANPDGTMLAIGTAASGNRNFFWYGRTQEYLDPDKEIKQALAYFCGANEYELNVNGTRIGRGANYDFLGESRYQGWDITDAIGDDISIALGVIARCNYGNQGAAVTNQYGLLGYAVVYYTDGTSQVITTDENWRFSRSIPLSGTATRNGEGHYIERYDARNEKANFSRVGYSTASSDWLPPFVLGTHPDTVFTHLNAEYGHVTETKVNPVSVTKIANGNSVVDFGKVIPARFAINFKGMTAGTQITLQPGYEVSNVTGPNITISTSGGVNTHNNSRQGTNMSHVFTAKAGNQTYKAWEHQAYRYIEIPSSAGIITVDDVSADVITGEVVSGRDATFDSSDAMLDQVFDLLQRSAKYSVQNQFVDTPTREAGQFLGDAYNISMATTKGTYERAWTKKAINQFLDSSIRFWRNTPENYGRFNAVYPNNDNRRDIPDYTLNMPVWIWNYYMETGDIEILEKAWPFMQDTADYITRNIRTSGAQEGLVTQIATAQSGSYQYGIVDWPQAGRFGYDMTLTNSRTVMNALSVRTYNTIASIAKELGKSSTIVDDYTTRANNLRTVMNEKLIAPDGVYSDGLTTTGTLAAHQGQHSTSFSVAFGVAPEDKVADMAEYLGSLGMQQGPMTVDILVEALFNAGRADLVVDLMTDTDDFGWANIISRGYTFTWEQWQNPTGSESFSHGWSAAALKQMIENFLGVKITKAGAETITIAPAYGVLGSLRGSAVTERGPVSVEYSGTGKDYTLKISVPTNVKAQVELPRIADGKFVNSTGNTGPSKFTEDAQIITVGSGTYTYVYADAGKIDELSTLADEVEAFLDGADEDIYTTTSWKALEDAFAEARKAIDNIDTPAADVNAALEALTDAYGGLALRASAGYLTMLDGFIEEAEAIDTSRYTTDSVADLVVALDAAKAIADDPTAYSDDDVYAAIVALMAAEDALVLGVDKNNLGDAINLIEEMLLPANVDKYIPKAVTAIGPILAAAKTVYDDPAASQTAVDNAYNSLVAASKTMIPKGDKATLRALVNLVKNLSASSYTPATFSTFQTSLTTAQAILVDDDAVQSQVDEAYANLWSAYSGLSRKANLSTLNVVIANAQQILANSSDYIATTIVGLQDSYDAAVAVRDNINSTQAQVDAARAALNDKVLTARLKIDRTALLGLFKQASAVSAKSYTPASYRLLTTAIDDAKAVLALPDEKVTTQQVTDTVNVLHKAMVGLQPVSDQKDTGAKTEKSTGADKKVYSDTLAKNDSPSGGNSSDNSTASANTSAAVPTFDSNNAPVAADTPAAAAPATDDTVVADGSAPSDNITSVVPAESTAIGNNSVISDGYIPMSNDSNETSSMWQLISIAVLAALVILAATWWRISRRRGKKDNQ